MSNIRKYKVEVLQLLTNLAQEIDDLKSSRLSLFIEIRNQEELIKKQCEKQKFLATLCECKMSYRVINEGNYRYEREALFDIRNSLYSSIKSTSDKIKSHNKALHAIKLILENKFNSFDSMMSSALLLEKIND